MKTRKQELLKNAEYGDWQMFGTNIRFRRVTYLDEMMGGVLTDYQFQTYGAPYFFGLLRRKKWEYQITTNALELGIEWCKHLLVAANIPTPPPPFKEAMQAAIDDEKNFKK